MKRSASRSAVLEVLPPPAELRLCDPYRSAGFFTDLEEALRRDHGYRGAVRVVSNTAGELRLASVIVGATNVANAIDVTELAPGTLIVDDSWPHCMSGPAALARLTNQRDILYTEGGFVRGHAPMPRITCLPGVPLELQRRFSGLNPHDITACILSALLSVRKPELAPTIGLIAPGVARQHWTALAEMRYSAAALNYEGDPLSADRIEAFRGRCGESPNRSAPFAAVV